MHFQCHCGILWYSTHFTSVSSHPSCPRSFSVTHLAPATCCAPLTTTLAFMSQQLHSANNGVQYPYDLLCTSRRPYPVFLSLYLAIALVAHSHLVGHQDNNTLQNKPKTQLLVTSNACTILDRTYQTYCKHSSSTTSLDDLTPRSGCLILLPSSQSWHNTNCNSKSVDYIQIFEREPLHFMYAVKGW